MLMKQKINIISVKCVVQGGQVNVNSINYSTRYFIRKFTGNIVFTLILLN